jgi:hypothetical protein
MGDSLEQKPNVYAHLHPPTIERIARPTKEQFESEYLTVGKPVVITDSLDGWPASSLWELGYFRKKMGARKIKLSVYPEGDHYRSMLHRYPPKDLPLAESVELIENDTGHRHYLAELNLDRTEIAADIRVPEYCDTSVVRNYFFLGRDTASALHYHPMHQVLVCQIFGEKRITLYPPEQTRLLYPRPWYHIGSSHMSEIDFLRPDFKKYPLFGQAKPLELVLRPGEMLFIPIHWSHAVENIGLAASVSVFWRARWRQWVLPYPGLRSLPNAGKIAFYAWLERLQDRLSNVTDK